MSKKTSLTAARLARHVEMTAAEIRAQLSAMVEITDDAAVEAAYEAIFNRRIPRVQNPDQDALSATTGSSKRTMHRCNKKMSKGERRWLRRKLIRKFLHENPTHPAVETKAQNYCMWVVMGVPCRNRLRNCCTYRHPDAATLQTFFAKGRTALVESGHLLPEHSSKHHHICTSVRMVNPRECTRQPDKCPYLHGAEAVEAKHDEFVKISEGVEGLRKSFLAQKATAKAAKASSAPPAAAKVSSAPPAAPATAAKVVSFAAPAAASSASRPKTEGAAVIATLTGSS